ncbi:hypothetical protein [Roseisolibacter agri]|uniref:Uncharacterized protein n=1 Tax=Roseisolibacter agri TaxID=2014610 RepID=A0AA37Q4F7_9BACT|nr:hypothetical protein [Roseisolibacter agri]GLC26389.1 hypothetical protein rosag_29020 [Roseisolibacter agri]
MKQNVSLTVASLLTIVLFTVHLAHDFIYGLDAMTRAGTFTFLAIVLVSTYGTLELAGRRLGYVVTLLLGLLAAGLPVLHHVGGPRSAGRGFFFVWTLLALGTTGALGAVLSLRGLWSTFRRREAR